MCWTCPHRADLENGQKFFKYHPLPTIIAWHVKQNKCQLTTNWFLSVTEKGNREDSWSNSGYCSLTQNPVIYIAVNKRLVMQEVTVSQYWRFFKNKLKTGGIQRHTKTTLAIILHREGFMEPDSKMFCNITVYTQAFVLLSQFSYEVQKPLLWVCSKMHLQIFA